MGSVNKVILVGNLGRDAELRATPSGQSVASFSIATTENWTGKDGQKHYTTEVKADKVVLLGGGAGRGGDRGDRGDGGGYSEPVGQPAGAITDDDIPF